MNILVSVLLLAPLALGASVMKPIANTYPGVSSGECDIPDTEFCDGEFLVKFTCVEKKILVSKVYKESCKKVQPQDGCVMPEKWCCRTDYIILYKCKQKKIETTMLYHPSYCGEAAQHNPALGKIQKCISSAA